MARRRKSVIEHINRMLETEPPRPLLPDNPSAALIAIAQMWDEGGDIVLQNTRVRGHEVTQMHLEQVRDFFAPFLDLSAAYIRIAQQSNERDTLRITAEDFHDLLRGRDALRCADAGYRFRDASFAAFADVDDEMLEKMAPVLARQHNGAICLMVLARGVKRFTLSRRKWASKVIHSKKSWCTRAFSLPKNARRLDRDHKAFVRKCQVHQREFIAYHNGDTFGIVRHICSPPLALRKLAYF